MIVAHRAASKLLGPGCKLLEAKYQRFRPEVVPKKNRGLVFGPMFWLDLANDPSSLKLHDSRHTKPQ